MTKKKLIVAPAAQQDLTDIFTYIAKENLDAASSFLEEITTKIGWITTSNFSGVARDWIRPGLRALPFKKRCIYFRTDSETVYIIRVVHTRQDVAQVKYADSSDI